MAPYYPSPKNEINKENDLVGCVLTMRYLEKGGSTNYYTGSTSNDPGRIFHIVPFQNGHLNNEKFEKILHGVGNCKEEHININFNFKKGIINLFEYNSPSLFFESIREKIPKFFSVK